MEAIEGREVAMEVDWATEIRAAGMVTKVELMVEVAVEVAVVTVAVARQGATVAMVGLEVKPQHTP